MSSLTTRLKLNVPVAASGDFADYSVYYNPNIVILETEIPGSVVSSLPAVGYNGQIRTINNSDAAPYASKLCYGGNGAVWTPVGNFNQKPSVFTAYPLADAWSDLTPSASGSELFESTRWSIGVTSLSMSKTSVFKLELQGLFTPSGANYSGNATIFIDPNSSNPPTPATAGTQKIIIPVTTANGTTNQTRQGFYGMGWYTPISTTVTDTPGIAIYLSAIQGQATATQVTAPGSSGTVGKATQLIVTEYPK